MACHLACMAPAEAWWRRVETLYLQVSLLVGPWLPMGGWSPNMHKHLVAPFKQQVRRGTEDGSNREW